MRIDQDVQGMDFKRRGEEIQKLRNAIRVHKKKDRHARCQFNDPQLYKKTLPEGDEGMGNMDLPFEVLMAGCRDYVRCQQRRLFGYKWKERKPTPLINPEDIKLKLQKK
jgi:hypothetical protein